MKAFVKYLVSMHQFFVKESPSFITPLTVKKAMFYPVAYCRFMWYSIGDFRRGFTALFLLLLLAQSVVAQTN